MNAVEFVVRVLDALDSLEIPYVTVGSFAVNAYVEPRSTRDADFVLQMDNLSIGKLVTRIGPDFILDPQMSFESVTLTTRYIIKHQSAIFTVEFFGLTDDSHDQMRFSRRVLGAVGQRKAYVLTPEDIVVTKLRWSVKAKRQKDIQDAKLVLATMHHSLDLDYIRKWCSEHGTIDVFEKSLEEVRNI